SFLVLRSARQLPDDLHKAGTNASLTEVILLDLAECYIWAVLGWFIFRLARRFPFEKGRWPLSLLVHVLTSIAFAFLESALGIVVGKFLRREIPMPTISPVVLQFYFIAKFNTNLVFYWVIFGISQVLAYHRESQERELRASQLEARLAQARLQVLRMQ